MKNSDWNKFAKYTALGLLAAALLLWVAIPAAEVVLACGADFLLAYAEKHPLGAAVIAAVVVGAIYAVCTSEGEKAPPPPPPPPPPPTMEDYFKVLDTVRPAVAEVASVLGLAPIDSHTDMATNSAERILRWERVWGFKYKALKRATTEVDVEQFARVIQTQVATVLDRDNPSKLSEINYNYCGHLVPVIQIAEVKDDDAYIYIYVVMASDTYFHQKEAEERAKHRPNTIHTDTSDKDF